MHTALLTLVITAVADDLPVNRWVKLDAAGDGHWGNNNLVWCPSRGQVLHWVNSTVLAFDAERGDWTADYPPPERLPRVPMGHGYGSTGVTSCGQGVMLDSGVPAPSYAIQAGCYNSKRHRIVFPMRGLMAVYDPVAKTWGEQEAKTVIAGREYPGGPPVFGVGACYDPVNDEVLIFPHYVGTGGAGVPFMDLPKNLDRRGIDGRISSHLGTLRFSYEDRTWRRVAETFGSDERKALRRKTFAALAKLSGALDAAWVIRRRPDEVKAKGIVATLAGVSEDFRNLGPFGSAAPHLAAVFQAARRSDWTAVLSAGRDALWAIENVIDGPLRVEPPPRCAAPMVYDAKHQVIVLFGGHSGLARTDLTIPRHFGPQPGALNDTWLYDVKTKQWREVAVQRRPPEQRLPHLFYDPDSERTLLAVFQQGDASRKVLDRVSAWTLDAEEGEWSKRHEQEWPWGLAARSTYAATTPRWEVGHDPKRHLLLVTQTVGSDQRRAAETYAMRLDLSALDAPPAPAYEPPPPLKPQTVPPDDPAWVATLKTLPANTWVPATPEPPAPSGRGWSNIACDQVRGHVYTFGGGHATYQINDVAIYAVGANAWSYAAGDHNDFVPAMGWGGCTMGYHGGKWAHHQRSQYVALDGRMYVGVQKADRIAEMNGEGRADGPPPAVTWFYDVDRGGIWRQQVLPEKNVTADEGVTRLVDAVHVTFPSNGRIIATYGERTNWGGLFVRVFDPYANALCFRKSGTDEAPYHSMEARPFCALRDRSRMFYLASDFDEKDVSKGGHQPWVYDVEQNVWTQLESKSLSQ